MMDIRDVKAGDTVTLERDGGRLPDQDVRAISTGANGRRALVLAGGIAIVVEGPDAWTITDHQPAPEPEPEPEPEWDSDADYVATVRGIPGLRVTWSPVDDSDRAPWRTRKGVGDGKWSWHEDRYVTDVRPLVVIDPAAVDVDGLKRVLASADYDYQAQADAALKFLGIKEGA